MTVPPYITPGEVQDYTGAKPEWFDLEGEQDPQAALVASLQSWIAHAQDLVTRFIGVEYDPNAAEDDLDADPPLLAQDPPEGVKSGVMRVVANIVNMARIYRQTAILQIDEYRQQVVQDRIFPRTVRDDLLLYQRKEPRQTAGISGSIGLRGISAPKKVEETDVFGDWTKMELKRSTLADVLAYWDAVI